MSVLRDVFILAGFHVLLVASGCGGDEAQNSPQTSSTASGADAGGSGTGTATATGSESADTDDSLDSGGDGSTGPGGGDPDAVVLVDANCIDGAYVADPPELFYTAAERPPIDDLIAGFEPENASAFVTAVLERRYPTGLRIFEQAGGARAIMNGIGSPNSPDAAISSLGLAIHETGHAIDRNTPDSWYYIGVDTEGNDISFTTPGMHGVGTFSGSPQFAMSRSQLLGDDENAKRPPEEDADIHTSAEFGPGEYGSDPMFAKIYLNGDPEDGVFQGGDQGYNMLMEEFVQYTNSLAVRHAFADVTFGTSSDRHAMLTWIWWNERYLRKLRAERPEEHQYLLDNDEWLEFVLTTWGRAWLYVSAEVPGFEPDTEYLHHLVQQPQMLEEIQVLRRAYGCNSSVELLPQYVGV